MMHNSWLFIGVISTGLAIPLTFAARTLLNMKHTRFVPLIRRRDIQGKTHLLVCPIDTSITAPFTGRLQWSPSVSS